MDAALNLTAIARELRRRRRDRGLTQQQLADRAGVSRSLLTRAERSDPTIAIGSILRLLNATGGTLEVTTSRLPTLEEAASMFGEDDD